MKDVHTEHCCKEHGCKYGDVDCSVVAQGWVQSFPCPQCRHDQEDSLRRAFVVSGTKYITMDGHTNTWLRNTIVYGQKQGWLTDGVNVGDSQWTVYAYRLTDAGQKHFFPGAHDGQA